MTFLNILGVTEILCSFKLGLEGKTGKETPESSRLEFLEKFSGNSFALSDAEDNTFETLNRRSIVDLPLLRTLLAIRKNRVEKGCIRNKWVNEFNLPRTMRLLKSTLFIVIQNQIYTRQLLTITYYQQTSSASYFVKIFIKTYRKALPFLKFCLPFSILSVNMGK